MWHCSEEAVVQMVVVVMVVAGAIPGKSLGGQGTVGVAGAVRRTTGAVDVELANRRDRYRCSSRCGSSRVCSSRHRCRRYRVLSIGRFGSMVSIGLACESRWR